MTIEYKAVDYIDYDDKKSENEDLKSIVSFISKNYENPELSLGMIRKKCGITENRISLLIKSEFNVSYTDYVNNIRIEEAKRMFQNSKLNINEVATLVGFGNISTFTRVFKAKEGMTAGQYINKLNN